MEELRSHMSQGNYQACALAPACPYTQQAHVPEQTQYSPKRHLGWTERSTGQTILTCVIDRIY